MNYEHREETKGPQSQARQAHENHNQLGSQATTFVWLDALSSALGVDDCRALALSRSAEESGYWTSPFRGGHFDQGGTMPFMRA